MNTKVVKVTATSLEYLTAHVLVPEDATEQELYDFLIVDDTNSLTIAEAMISEGAGDWEWGDIYDEFGYGHAGLSFVDELLEQRTEERKS